MSDFLDFLLTSPQGRQVQDGAKNNIGTWYDVQTMSLALFVDRKNVAEELAGAATKRRLEVQIAEDGKQPRELSRTRSFNYSVSNLVGLFELATLAKNVDVDLWNSVPKKGAGIHRHPNGSRLLASLCKARRPMAAPADFAVQPKQLAAAVMASGDRL